MADKLGLGNEVRELKIGQSFTNPKSTAFHTIKYDFKPASVDVNKIANVSVGNNNQVTVTVPHLDGAGTQHTVFKGSQRPFNKECVLIIDKNTGEITLEKLSGNIQLKKTRSESVKPLLHQDRLSDKGSSSLNVSRSQTPPNVGQRTSSKTKVTSGSRRADRQITHLVPKHSPLHASPNYPSPGHHKSPKRERELHSMENHSSHSTLASLPMIGMDDPPPIVPVPHNNSQINNGSSNQMEKSPTYMSDVENGVEEMSDSSSSSSSSDSESDNDRTVVIIRSYRCLRISLRRIYVCRNLIRMSIRCFYERMELPV
ncbi:RNA polymerase II transcription elongation factor [Popillia japonica]|uniref:Ell-associated factor Eaf n=1 Tax=Popillia japonica TaxID=7064 RepID=A0AAW1N597_POPJA